MYSEKDTLPALHVAAAAGDVKDCEYLLSMMGRDAVDKEVTDDGMTALHMAVHQGRTDVVNLLLENGANLQIQTRNGATVYFLAAESGKVSVLRELVAAEHKSYSDPLDAFQSTEARVRTARVDGQTPLYAAASRGHSDMVRKLCILGADMSVTANNGLSPLHAAAQGGHVAAVTALLEQGVSEAYKSREPTTETPRDIAFLDMMKRVSFCCTGDPHQRHELANSLPLGNTCGLSSLCLAASLGHVAVIETLMKLCCDCIESHEVHFSLVAAVLSNHDKVICALKSRVPNDMWYDVPLLAAAVLNHSTNIKTLIALGAKPSRRCFSHQITPLHAAAAYGNVDAISSLIDAGASLLSQDANGWTPLHAASSMGHLSAVKVLIERDWYAGVIQARNRATPLHCAALFGHPDVLVALSQCIEVACLTQKRNNAASYTTPDIRDTIVAAVSLVTVTTPTSAENLAHVLRTFVDSASTKASFATAEVRDACVMLALSITTSTAACNLAFAFGSVVDGCAPAKALFATKEVRDACVRLSSVTRTTTGAGNLAYALGSIAGCSASTKILFATAEVRDACVRLASSITTPTATRNLAYALRELVDGAPALFATAEVRDVFVRLSLSITTTTTRKYLRYALQKLTDAAPALFATAEVRNARRRLTQLTDIVSLSLRAGAPSIVGGAFFGFGGALAAMALSLAHERLLETESYRYVMSLPSRVAEMLPGVARVISRLDSSGDAPGPIPLDGENESVRNSSFTSL
ncbi:ankyrin repeat protein, putative [Bodo saltans]|uniref:Ankyrin repeat protein, putative n=1 Tax=Bodo saltans TaxID=75058 RepID=A0A0S4IWU7_BODSA|nr:ankyrin repeat protein, putative [Bodo saltans]|eukprot:CUG06483.1 ankyrin repeat protein, putative [Bodo saltans]